MPQVKKTKKWTLKQTLKRKMRVRPLERQDTKYMWAAYKKGLLKEIINDDNLTSGEFQETFEPVISLFDAAWVVECKVGGQMIPCALYVGTWHPYLEDVMFIALNTWFPWASKRNVIEGSVKFFNDMRKKIAFMGYASKEHKRLYEIISQHGIMRRIGTTHNVYDGQPAALFETRKAKEVA